MISIFTYIFIVIAGIILLVFIAGLLLPDERTATSECFYNASPGKVYNALINNADYGYRSDLEEIVIVEEKDGIEVWDEIAKNGSVIRFRTARKVPHSLYEFEIVKGNGFTGYWKGELKVTSTEELILHRRKLSGEESFSGKSFPAFSLIWKSLCILIRMTCA